MSKVYSRGPLRSMVRAERVVEKFKNAGREHTHGGSTLMDKLARSTRLSARLSPRMPSQCAADRLYTRWKDSRIYVSVWLVTTNRTVVV